MKTQHLWSAARPLASLATTAPRSIQIRCLHKTRPAPSIPATRPFVPDVTTFLTLIGRGLSKHASKFPSWDALFSLTSPELKELGIEPPRNRKYLLQWMDRYRRGVVGPGGDFQFVQDGEALLKVATPPASDMSDAKWVVNVPKENEAAAEASPTTLPRPNGYTVRGLRSIAGPFAQVLPGRDGAIVKVTEGMWEQKQGRKIDGGERRRAEVQFRKRAAERKARRDAESLARL
ncbi:hypothetical protein VHEMI10026 [[Torrubiella] hemipterigena]|uniref:Small ribosomal subunit protein mS41 n=1 Tax=[Torrubiella] hemipterigena TaxID=1531966 RepID=A0A0A1TSK6_9HYPO|nr:hypothetical protein VHEMI10026 [[Torrubiella] hemipterigena]